MKKTLFLYQDTLELLLTRQQVSLQGTLLTVTGNGTTYTLIPTVKVISCETSKRDPHKIVNRYIPIDILRKASAEIYVTSIIYRNQSYAIEQGFICNRCHSPAKV